MRSSILSNSYPQEWGPVATIVFDKYQIVIFFLALLSKKRKPRSIYALIKTKKYICTDEKEIKEIHYFSF